MVAIEFHVGKKEKVLLRSSDFGYELCWQRVQKGCTVWTPEKYYASLPTALDRVFQLKIGASDATTLRELRTVVEEVRRELVEVWEGQADMAG